MHIQKYRRNEFVPLMVELVKLYHPKVYVEIGIAEGYTFSRMTMQPEIETAVGVDIELRSHMRSQNYRTQNAPIFYEMTSHEFATKWNTPIDMLFIDGSHDKDVVEHDFFEIGKFVRPGTGLILMHDTHPMTEELLQPQYCHNAWEFADELLWKVTTQDECGGLFDYKRFKEYRSMGEVEIVTFPGPWAGMTIVKKRGEHHLCWKNGET